MKQNESNNGIDKSLKGEYKSFSRFVTLSLIIGIIIVSSFIIYFLFNPEPGSSTLFILNEDKKLENYPTNATVGENISFYVGVGNYYGKDFHFQIRILKGDNNTTLGDHPSENADLNMTLGNYSLANNEEWTSPKLYLSFYDQGNHTIIAELWEITSESQLIFINIVFLRIFVSI